MEHYSELEFVTDISSRMWVDLRAVSSIINQVSPTPCSIHFPDVVVCSVFVVVFWFSLVCLFVSWCVVLCRRMHAIEQSQPTDWISTTLYVVVPRCSLLLVCAVAAKNFIGARCSRFIRWFHSRFGGWTSRDRSQKRRIVSFWSCFRRLVDLCLEHSEFLARERQFVNVCSILYAF